MQSTRFRTAGPNWVDVLYPCYISGEYEASVKHLTNAINISGQPQQLVQVFQQTLPPDVFKMLMASLASTVKSTTATAQVCLSIFLLCLGDNSTATITI